MGFHFYLTVGMQKQLDGKAMPDPTATVDRTQQLGRVV